MHGGKWVDDMLYWKIRNLATGAVYVLDADTYHGLCLWHLDRSTHL